MSDVPAYYYSAVNEHGVRNDREYRPELMFGAYEFKAPAAFVKQPPL